jgi:hypothetical protein
MKAGGGCGSEYEGRRTGVRVRRKKKGVSMKD